MSSISTHVLDTSRGKPAAGIEVTLEREEAGSWRTLGSGVTDKDGRNRELLPDKLVAATYRLRFVTGKYFERLGQKGFYPEVSIVFVVSAADEHHHVPLLLSPYGFSTYRGS
jgi:5-hydroxyisourate hydrolase